MNGAPWQDETVQALKEDYQRVIDQHAATIARLRGLLEDVFAARHYHTPEETERAHNEKINAIDRRIRAELEAE